MDGLGEGDVGGIATVSNNVYYEHGIVLTWLLDDEDGYLQNLIMNVAAR